MRTRLLPLVIALALTGCTTAGRENAHGPIEDRDWDLVALGERDHPLGNGGRPVTLRFDAAERRAGGNAGCNRYNARYVLTADSLHFAAASSTRMACVDGMELESAWLGALSRVVTWSATDSTLTLAGPDGPLARFEAHQEP
jgi:heat shock protein HslJ